MKHYTKMKNGDEYDLLDPRTRRYVGHKAKFLAKTKAEYRRRERAALKRMTAELVDDELHGYRDDERAYWWGEFERCALDLEDLETAEVYLRETGQWSEDHTRIFAMAYREIRNRTSATYDEWHEAA